MAFNITIIAINQYELCDIERTCNRGTNVLHKGASHGARISDCIPSDEESTITITSIMTLCLRFNWLFRIFDRACLVGALDLLNGDIQICISGTTRLFQVDLAVLPLRISNDYSSESFIIQWGYTVSY